MTEGEGGGFCAGAYLASFCVASVLVMGIFGACWGELTARIGSSRRATCGMVVVSSGISIVVGIFWLALIATGTFGDVLG